MSTKIFFPWYVRLVAKVFLSRLPFSYGWWSRFGLFRHGAMDDFSYAWEVLQKHTSELKKSKGWRGLELGPGDGLLSAFLVPVLGSSGLTLVDAGDFSHKDVEQYRKQISRFSEVFPDASVIDFSEESDMDVILNSVGCSYHVNGLKSLQLLESNSFDLIYSQAVLEHVRRFEFEDMMLECYRLLHPDGIMSHVVDYKDHLGGGLNHMRFSSELWERDWFAEESGFYTNRMRMSEMIFICRGIGFDVDIRNVSYWKSLPIKRDHLAKEFHYFSDDELLVSGAHLVMRQR
jgi:SAM-dependent methyltransferase